MSIKIKIDPDATSEELAQQQEEKAPPVMTISLEARKTLDGKIMILDHMHLDIILDTSINKITTFPKEELTDEIYGFQSKYFNFLKNEGVIGWIPICGILSLI